MLKRLLCFMQHDWTSLAQEGIKPSRGDLPEEGDDSETILRKFHHYAAMYCKRCGKIYKDEVLYP